MAVAVSMKWHIKETANYIVHIEDDGGNGNGNGHRDIGEQCVGVCVCVFARGKVHIEMKKLS